MYTHLELKKVSLISPHWKEKNLPEIIGSIQLENIDVRVDQDMCNLEIGQAIYVTSKCENYEINAVVIVGSIEGTYAEDPLILGECSAAPQGAIQFRLSSVIGFQKVDIDEKLVKEEFTKSKNQTDEIRKFESYCEKVKST